MPTLIRGQWTHDGTGTPTSAFTVSNGTLKDVDNNFIPSGTICGLYANDGDVTEQFSFGSGGTWDSTNSQFIMGPGNFPSMELNVFDVSTGTWNPSGRLCRPWTEFMNPTRHAYTSAQAYGSLNAPSAFIDWQDHYQDISEINTVISPNHAMLPSAVMHMGGNCIWMPSINSVVYIMSYGGYPTDQGQTYGVWTFSRTTNKWSHDITGADLYPDPNHQNIGASCLDTTRNRIITMINISSGFPGQFFSYDPAQALGSRIARFGAPLNSVSMYWWYYPVLVYDAKRDQVRVYGYSLDFNGQPTTPFNGQFGILDFSANGGTPTAPAVSTFLPSGTFVFAPGSGVIYDSVADRDVVWFAGTSFTSGGAGPCGRSVCGDSRTMYVVHPDTHVSTSLVPSGAIPDIMNSGIAGNAPWVWNRFGYLPSIDAYAVIPSQSTAGAYYFAPDRTSGPLSTATIPHLAFTDLAQGPRTGNSDTAFGQIANQDGVYVTVWGHNLGSSQLTSVLTLGGVAQRIISWGNATGPGANLYNGYQKFQAIVFQVVAATPLGAQSLTVTVGGVVSAALTFTITAGGTIRFSSTSGSAQGLCNALGSGDVGYILQAHTAPSGITLNNDTSAFANPAALVAYPGADVQCGDATHNGITRGAGGSGPKMIYSKISIFGGPGAGDEGVTLGDSGRLVGCKIQAPNGNGSSGSAGCRGSNIVFYGNEFTDCGRHTGVDDLYHTLYIYGFRNQGVPALETERDIGWNYFHNNNALRAVNIYNGEFNGNDPITHHRIHDNVILDQVGDGILLGVGVVGENWVYNNLVLNVGIGLYAGNAVGMNIRAQDPPNIPATGLPPLIHCFNNTFINCGSTGSSVGIFEFVAVSPTYDIYNNIFYQATGKPYISPLSTNVIPAGQVTKNCWFGYNPTPSFDGSPVNLNPQVVANAEPFDCHLRSNSPCIGAGTSPGTTTPDFDGTARPSVAAWDIGALQFFTNAIPGPNAFSLSPSSTLVGSPQFTLTVSGSNFQVGAVVTFNGQNRTTTYVNSGQLTATILASDVSVAGSYPVIVQNPGPTNSNTLIFTVTLPSPLIDLSFLGMLRDATSGLALGADGFSDGVWRVTLHSSGGKTVTRLRMQVLTGEWNTLHDGSNYVLGAALTQSGTLLNDPSTLAVNFAVADNGSWYMFGSDFPVSSGILFTPGTVHTLTVTYSDGATSTKSVTVGSGAAPSLLTATPDTGPVGTSIVFTATGLGAVQGGSSITIGGQSASVSSWSDTSATAQIPSSLFAGTYNAIATTASGSSNALTITVTGSGSSPGFNTQTAFMYGQGL